MATDFARIMDPARREHFVYRLYDAAGDLLYIGCSYRPEARIKDHRTNQPWGKRIASARYAGPFTYAKAREIEKQAVRDEDPPQNGQAPSATRRRAASHRAFERILADALAKGWTHDQAVAIAAVAADEVRGA